ncbi:MAG: YdcF family protein [Cyanobacteria bacterium]|nr:YdcF family protein [Cyanobacteriota bacterium]MDW8201630.1 YdcF family protein [Cyanobacteriota bacterium SKYGB_h_bin112]
MFLFLSKLLPLFIYPLGLSCLLLVVALVTLWKWPRVAASTIVGALVLLLGSSNAWVSDSITKFLERQYIPAALPVADAIVVLGGGIKPPHPPRPAPDVAEPGDRILYGAQLYNDGKAPWLILSGGRVVWRQSGESESADMAVLAQRLGVPASAIIEEPTSLNTYENAVNIKQILDARKLKRVLLVTSALHMPRSLLIFQKQGIEAIPAPTDFLVADEPLPPEGEPIQAIVLKTLPDAAKLHQISLALKEYIGLVVYWLKGWL